MPPEWKPTDASNETASPVSRARSPSPIRGSNTAGLDTAATGGPEDTLPAQSFPIRRSNTAGADGADSGARERALTLATALRVRSPSPAQRKVSLDSLQGVALLKTQSGLAPALSGATIRKQPTAAEVEETDNQLKEEREELWSKLKDAVNVLALGDIYGMADMMRALRKYVQDLQEIDPKFLEKLKPTKDETGLLWLICAGSSTLPRREDAMLRVLNTLLSMEVEGMMANAGPILNNKCKDLKMCPPFNRHSPNHLGCSAHRLTRSCNCVAISPAQTASCLSGWQLTITTGRSPLVL